jgi:hypothetical protein
VPLTCRQKLISTALIGGFFTCLILFTGSIDNRNSKPLAAAQENNSNILPNSQVGDVTNMSGSTEQDSKNFTDVKNITQVSNATSGEAIPLQQIVTLRDSATDSDLNDLVNEVKSKGAEIIYTYNQLKSFAFRASNTQVLSDIITDLKNNPSVLSVTTDKTAGIMPQ